jgi:hypothetical protein
MSEPYFAPASNAMLALEGMVGHAGLRNVLWALAAICRRKSEAIGGLDSPSACAWGDEAARISSLAGKVKVS